MRGDDSVYQMFLIIFLIVAVTLIALIMLQQNKNNNTGGIFDNRTLGNILNSRGLSNGVNRLIVILAILFFVLSLLLGNMNSKHHKEHILSDFCDQGSNLKTG